MYGTLSQLNRTPEGFPFLAALVREIGVTPGRPKAILLYHITDTVPYGAKVDFPAMESFIAELAAEGLSVVTIPNLGTMKIALADHLPDALRRAAVSVGSTPAVCPKCASHDLVIRPEFALESDSADSAYSSKMSVLACGRCNWVGESI